MTDRIRSWQSDLLAWAERQAGQTFVWGETDCAALARRGLAVLFGRDVVPAVPRWGSPEDGARTLAAHPIDQVLRALGATETTAAFVRAGDVVLLPSKEPAGRPNLMLCLDGATFLAASQDAGVRILHRDQIPELAEAVVYSLWTISELAEEPPHG